MKSAMALFLQIFGFWTVVIISLNIGIIVNSGSMIIDYIASIIGALFIYVIATIFSDLFLKYIPLAIPNYFLFIIGIICCFCVLIETQYSVVKYTISIAPEYNSVLLLLLLTFIEIIHTKITQ